MNKKTLKWVMAMISRGYRRVKASKGLMTGRNMEAVRRQRVTRPTHNELAPCETDGYDFGYILVMDWYSLGMVALMFSD